MKLLRLKGRKTSERVLAKGAVWRGRNMTIRYLLGAPHRPDVDRSKPAIYLGTFASGKLHKSAVKRNRMRRRCREALRVALQKVDDLPTAQLLLSPRSSSLDSPYGSIQDDVAAFLSVLRSCPPRNASTS